MKIKNSKILLSQPRQINNLSLNFQYSKVEIRMIKIIFPKMFGFILY